MAGEDPRRRDLIQAAAEESPVGGEAETHAVDGWIAYYTEDRRFTSEDTDWVDLPDDGVLHVQIFLDAYAGADNSIQYSTILSGDDWYFHVPGTDLYGSNDDTPEEIEERYPGAVCKRGKWTDPATFKAVRERAENDEWPPQ